MPALPFPHDELEVGCADALAQHRDGAIELVDVRESYEFEAGHVAGAHHLELGQLSARFAELPADRPIVFYCRVGVRSAMAAEAFRGAGYDAWSMAGGLVAWARHGLPLEPADGTVAAH